MPIHTLKLQKDTRTAVRVSLVTMSANTLLFAFKLAAGILAHSGAMISDAVHTISDVFSTLAVLIGFGLSGKSPDKEHPYGHERIECLVALLLSAMLLAVGAGIGLEGVMNLRTPQISGIPHTDTQLLFNTLALCMALISVGAKEWMYRYTLKAARAIGSASLEADAWHHRSDALSSLGGFAGLLGLRLGFPLVDPLASLIICVFVCKASLDIAGSAVNQLIDHSLDDQETEAIRAVILREPAVLSLDSLKTRMFASKAYVDVEVAMDGAQSLEQAHAAAQRIHETIEREFPRVKHCMVHVNPYRGR